MRQGPLLLSWCSSSPVSAFFGHTAWSCSGVRYIKQREIFRPMSELQSLHFTSMFNPVCFFAFIYLFPRVVGKLLL